MKIPVIMEPRNFLQTTEEYSVINLPARIPSLTDSEIGQLGEKYGINGLKKESLHPNGPSIWELAYLTGMNVLSATFGSQTNNNLVFQDKTRVKLRDVCIQAKNIHKKFKPTEVCYEKIVGDLVVGQIAKPLNLPTLIRKVNETFDFLQDTNNKADPNAPIISKEVFIDIFRSFDDEFEKSMFCEWLRSTSVTADRLYMVKTRLIWLVIHLRIAATRLHNPRSSQTIDGFFGTDRLDFDNIYDAKIAKESCKVVTVESSRREDSVFWSHVYSNSASRSFRENITMNSEIKKFLEKYYSNVQSSCIKFFDKEKNNFTGCDVEEVHDLCLELSRSMMDDSDYDFHVEELIPPLDQLEKTTKVQYNMHLFAKALTDKFLQELLHIDPTISRKDAENASRIIVSFQADIIIDFLRYIFKPLSSPSKVEQETTNVRDRRVKREDDSLWFSKRFNMDEFSEMKISRNKSESIWLPLLHNSSNTTCDFMFFADIVPQIPVELLNLLRKWMESVKNDLIYLLKANVFIGMIDQMILKHYKELYVDYDIDRFWRHLKRLIPKILKLGLNNDVLKIYDDSIDKIIDSMGQNRTANLYDIQVFDKVFEKYSKRTAKIFEPYGMSEEITKDVQGCLIKFIVNYSTSFMCAFLQFQKQNKRIAKASYLRKLRIDISDVDFVSASSDLRARIPRDMRDNRMADDRNNNWVPMVSQRESRPEKPERRAMALDEIPPLKEVKKEVEPIQMVAETNQDEQMLIDGPVLKKPKIEEPDEETFEWTNTDFFESSENVTFPHNPLNYTCAADVPIVITLTEPEMSTLDIKMENTDVTMDQDVSPVSSLLKRNSIDDDQELDAEVEEPAVKRLKVSEIEAAERQEEEKEYLKQWMGCHKLPDDWKDAH